MRRVALVAAALVAVTLPAVAAAGVKITNVDSHAYPALRVTVVTSTPTSRKPLLRENGSPAAGVQSDNLGENANVALAIDRSQSMANAGLADALAAARSFIANKTSGTSVELIAFGSRAVDLTDFSTARIDSDDALRTVSLDKKQGTALWDAVVLAAAGLKSQPFGGRVLILLTDGADTTSEASEAEAVSAVRRAGVAVYPIGIESDQFSPASLKRIASQTGGTYHAAASTASLSTVYAEVARELERTWNLSYSSAARPGDSPALDVSFPGQGADGRRVPLDKSLGAGAVPDGPDPIVPQRAFEHGLGTLALMLAVGLMTLAAAALLLTAPRAKRLRRRLDPHVDAQAKRAKATPRERLEAANGLLNATERAFARFSVWKRLQKQIDRADLPVRPVELFYICIGCAFVPALVFAFAGAPSIFLLALMVAGAAAPLAFVLFKAKQRLNQIDESLPDLLITLAASLKAGHSFRQGIQAAAEEGDTPLTRELKRVLTETSLGRQMDDALNEMSERIGSKDVAFVITAVTIQRQVGGSLAGIFDLVADTIRQRQQFARKIKGLTAMGRMSAYVLVGLPIFLAFILTLINREYMSPLWSTPTGHLMIEMTLVAIAIGAYLLRRIVSFRS
jgi:tight adherence protein B